MKRMVVSAVVVSLGIFSYLLSYNQKGSNLTKEEMKQIYKVCQSVSSGGGTRSNSKIWNCKYDWYGEKDCKDWQGYSYSPYDACSPGAG